MKNCWNKTLCENPKNVSVFKNRKDTCEQNSINHCHHMYAIKMPQ